MQLFKRAKRDYFSACEYWVYVPGEEVPSQEKLITRMVAENPHSRDGYSAIGSKEGMLFSDVRLHIGLVLRSKNPHVFRPDLFGEAVHPTEETLSRLAKAHAVLKVRYVSQIQLPDDRHIQFTAHLADAVADLEHGTVIYDVVSEQLRTAEDYKAMLAIDREATRFDAHVQVVWFKEAHAGHGQTRGLIKKGLPELRTDDAHLDHQVLVTEVLLEAARKIWNQGEIPNEMEIPAYDDTFRLSLVPTKTGPYRVRIARIALSS